MVFHSLQYSIISKKIYFEIQYKENRDKYTEQLHLSVRNHSDSVQEISGYKEYCIYPICFPSVPMCNSTAYYQLFPFQKSKIYKLDKNQATDIQSVACFMLFFYSSNLWNSTFLTNVILAINNPDCLHSEEIA